MKLSFLALAISLATLLGCSGCGAAATPGQVVSTVVMTVETATCIINTYSQDEASGMATVAIVADVVAKCNTDAQSVISLWAAHVHAEAIDPTPKPAPVMTPDGGIIGNALPENPGLERFRMLRRRNPRLPVAVGGDK